MNDDPQKILSRREFVAVGISSGFALATLPVMGTAITTTSDGIVAEDAKIPVGSAQTMPGYHAMPKGKGPFPTVIVIQEIFGVHAYIQDVCRRLAKEGYLAIAPSLYFRQGDVTKISDTKKIIDDVVSKVPQKQVMDDIGRTLTHYRNNRLSDPQRVAITGFCWGGNVTWMYAAQDPTVKCGVAWYGRLVKNPGSPNPQFPVDIAKDLKVPVLGLYGGKDGGIPAESIEEMRKKLAEGKSHSEIVVYPEADHGFHADYRPSYHEASARDGWKKMLAWFKQHGV